MLRILYIIITITFLCFLSLPANVIGQSLKESKYESKVEIENLGETLAITAKFDNQTSDSLSLSYDLNTVKQSASGKSDSKQSGYFVSMPNSVKILAKVGLNIEKDMNYDIILKVFNNETLISSDTVSFKSNQ